MTLLCALWSVVAWPLAFVWMAGIVLVSISVSWFVPFHRFQHRFPARMMGMVPRFAWARIQVHRHPEFDPSRSSFYLQNHVSMFDGHVALHAIPGRFCGLENAAHYRIPFYGWLMRHGGGIPVYPGQPNQLERLVKEAKDRVARGYSILAFPEGHRTLDGQLGEFRRGAFVMAVKIGLPIVPVAVRGLRKVFPKGTWILRPGRIEVVLGPTIETSGLTEDDVPALMQRVRAHLQAALAGETPAIATAELVS